MAAVDFRERKIGLIARPDFDVAQVASSMRTKVPQQVAPASAIRDRQDFLSQSLSTGQAEGVFERVLQGNELQPISYFARGVIAAMAVARIDIRSPEGRGWGTGFLISPQVLITNHHVLPDADTARQSTAHFGFEIDLADKEIGPLTFALEPDRLFHTSQELDFTVVAVAPRSTDGTNRVEGFGYLPLLDAVGKATEGEWLTIIQHPNGERKQVCVRENQLLKRAETMVWYSTDTMPGSSGSPVFNNDWFVVALHHAGVPAEIDGQPQTTDGRVFDPKTMPDSAQKWIANEGIRASRIAQTLRGALPDHPLLQPMFAATPETARIAAGPNAQNQPLQPWPLQPPSEQRIMSDLTKSIFPMDLKLRIEADGRVSAMPLGATESVRLGAEASRTAARTASIEAPFDGNYAGRKGYDAGFLGHRVVVNLPKIGPALMTEVAKLIKKVGNNDHVLHYHNYSLVMHAERRLALYSAANLDFANRFQMSRPTDVWRRDPRILAKYQLEDWYYKSNNFDRGHLTRREDLEYGATRKGALQSAADTCHWTNCTPQHARFNQNKEIWQGIERYILESRILEDDIKAQVITGPVLDEGDPDYKEIQYPVSYWKVVAALDEHNKLFATAYIASQADVIAQYGIEAAPFGAFMTFQTTVSEIERLTGLSFTYNGNQPLTERDPLTMRPARRRRASGTHEAMSAALPPNYWPINALEDIRI